MVLLPISYYQGGPVQWGRINTKTKVKSPQTNGICERFHKTVLQEFYQVALAHNVQP
jgi:transposase InsO family protein